MSERIVGWILFLLFSTSVGYEEENKYTDPNHVSDLCLADDGTDKNQCSKSGRNELTRLDGVEVGHTRLITLDGDKPLHISTLNMKPLIFEIKDFFTEAECEHMINLAKKIGLESSITQQESKGVNGIKIMDSNGDQKLDFTEMKITIEDNFDIYLDDADLRTIYADLGIDPNKNDLVTKEEMSNVTPREMTEYMNYLVKTSPTKKSRFSEQAWIFPDNHKDKLLDKFKRRLKAILGIPPMLVDKHNAIQVVHYGQHGHYNAHQDSGSTNLPCCHLHKNTKCMICRYLTFMVYLNDVEEGGETAFPVANNKTFNQRDFRHSGSTHLNSKCSEANLRLKPERGKAVLWYNHLINEETGWLGELDDFTWHGGCPVTKGTKWIMNRWINASPDKEVDLQL
ncbi:transmembrane prolyl 4-hydroxylase-like isoform X2 [Anneissia japonica]|uniref:transmembrane prolyl 4-hydroxylase-like isoform X1 n=1 Tax=Anneissia japonica TaxID=1529436 RepID=UPI001425B8C2|nr:transmembrane prolyl 4-hydroxylase-like isoform X1 [Anneissia japonica]XP_033118304.1 transmembrane prolyl 4-hydroxylase-like isoform X2 [Anneissia japonica]